MNLLTEIIKVIIITFIINAFIELCSPYIGENGQL